MRRSSERTALIRKNTAYLYTKISLHTHTNLVFILVRKGAVFGEIKHITSNFFITYQYQRTDE